MPGNEAKSIYHCQAAGQRCSSFGHRSIAESLGFRYMPTADSNLDRARVADHEQQQMHQQASAGHNFLVGIESKDR